MELDQAIYSFGGAYVNILLGGWCVCVCVKKEVDISSIGASAHLGNKKSAERESHGHYYLFNLYFI